MNWTEYFFEIAKTVSIRSNCLRAQVGAVIADEDHHVRSTGYNGTPHKVLSCKEAGICYRIQNNIPSGTMYETCRSIHAEQNAIIQAGIDKCKGSTLYVFGHDEICILCKRFIVQAGIKEVFIIKNEDSSIFRFTKEELMKSLEDAVKK